MEKKYNFLAAIYTIFGALMTMIGIKSLIKTSNIESKDIEKKTNEQLIRLIAKTISDRIDAPLATLIYTLKDPQQNPDLWDEINKRVKACKITYRQGNKFKINILITIEWEDGKETLLKSEWEAWSIPRDVNRQLRQDNQPVVRYWTLD